MIWFPIQLLAQQTSGGGTAMAAGSAVFIIFLIIIFATSIFWLWMLIDCILSSKPAVEKLIWLLVIFFFHIFGAVAYFFLGRGKGTI